jgi:Lsr2
MAERIIRQLIDDLDGTEIPQGMGEQVEFALRGVAYRIDLGDANVAKLEKALAPFIKSAEKLPGSSGGSRGRKTRQPNATLSKKNSSLSKKDSSSIRMWASKHGHTVSSRGRIPARVVEAYEAAQKRK